MRTTFENPELALKNAEKMKKCPKNIFLATNGCECIAVYVSFSDTKWWFELPTQKPELLGAENVSVEYLDNIFTPTLSDFDNTQSLDRQKNIAPCGTNCLLCPMREERNCPGCPAVFLEK